jgi:hypothetical protein
MDSFRPSKKKAEEGIGLDSLLVGGDSLAVYVSSGNIIVSDSSSNSSMTADEIASAA